MLAYLLQFGKRNQKPIADYCEIERAAAGGILTRMETTCFITRTAALGKPPFFVCDADCGKKGCIKKNEADFIQEEKVCTDLTIKNNCSFFTCLEKLCGTSEEMGN